MTDSLEEVKGLVTRALDAQGVLAKLKAEIRSHVFTAIFEQQRLGNPDLTTPLSQACSARQEAVVALSLVHDFLQHYSLSSTAAVLRPESNIDDGAIMQAASLAGSIGVPSSFAAAAGGASLLERLISSLSSPKGAASSSSSSAASSSSSSSSSLSQPLKSSTASKFNFSSDAAPPSRPAAEPHSPNRNPPPVFPDNDSPDSEEGGDEGLSSTVKHNPFPPSVSRTAASFPSSHTSTSSRPSSSLSFALQRSAHADAAAATAPAAARPPAPAPALFKRDNISDDDEIKSEYDSSFEEESSHSRKGEQSLDGISVSDHSMDNSHGESYDMVEAAAQDAGSSPF